MHANNQAIATNGSFAAWNCSMFHSPERLNVHLNKIWAEEWALWGKQKPFISRYVAEKIRSSEGL